MEETSAQTRRERWAGKRGFRGLGAVSRLRWAGVPQGPLRAIGWELYRQRHGLEARAVVALAVAPADAVEEARGTLDPRQFLTAPYAALVVVLLDPETPAPVAARARADLAARPYLPDATDETGWRAELRWCVAELLERRGRWDTAVSDEKEKKVQRRERRSRRQAALATLEPPRIRRKDLAAWLRAWAHGEELPADVAERLATAFAAGARAPC